MRVEQLEQLNQQRPESLSNATLSNVSLSDIRGLSSAAERTAANASLPQMELFDGGNSTQAARAYTVCPDGTVVMGTGPAKCGDQS